MPFDRERPASPLIPAEPRTAAQPEQEKIPRYFGLYVPKLENGRMFERKVVANSGTVLDSYLDGNPGIQSGPHVLVTAEERSSLQPLMTMEELRELRAIPINMEWPTPKPVAHGAPTGTLPRWVTL